MQYRSITKSATSQIITVSIYDSSSTTGAKLAGLVHNSAGLTAYYNRTGAAGAATAIALVTATKGTWVSSGFIAVDGTNMPGDYELHIPNAAIASGADSVLLQLKGATNMVPVNILIDLKAVDLQDPVRAGLSTLPASGTLAVNPTLAATTHTGAIIPTVSTVTNGAKSATALSTVTWTATIAGRIDAAVSTRASQTDVTLLIAGTIKANTAGSFHTQLTDSSGDPVASQPVSVQRLLDNGTWSAISGSASDTDANGHTLLSYSAADVNGTSAASFKLSATGARDTYLNFKLSA